MTFHFTDNKVDNKTDGKASSISNLLIYPQATAKNHSFPLLLVYCDMLKCGGLYYFIQSVLVILHMGKQHV